VYVFSLGGSPLTRIARDSAPTCHPIVWDYSRTASAAC
jgi:hypothetical protein